MSTSRRGFLKGAGLAFIATASPVLPLAGEIITASGDADVEPFVQMGGTRIVGTRELAAHGWLFTLAAEKYPGGKRYRWGIKNSASQSRLIDFAGLVLPPIPHAEKRQWRVYLDSGRSGWSGVKRLESLGEDKYFQPIHQKKSDGNTEILHQSDMDSVLWDAVTGTSLLAGFLRQRHGRNFIRVIPNDGATDIVRLEAVQELGFEIAPGGEQPLDPLVTSTGADPYALLEVYGKAVADYHGKKLDAPPIVGMMTWYGYGTAIDESIILENAQLIASLFRGYPQKMQLMMLCDHGWQQDANWGYWHPDQTRFPHGIKWLAAQMANYGVAMGLWYTPFCITPNAPNHMQLLPLEALDAKGRPYTSDACVWGHLPGQPACMPITFFDGGLPAVQKEWGDTLARMKSWGTVYWKLDFFSLRTSSNNRHKLGDGELYAQTYKTFQAAAGDATLNPCSCDCNLQVGYCDSTRVSADMGQAGDWSGTIDGFRHGMGTIAALWYKHRNFFVNDPDSIQVAKGCSLAEARVRATVVAMSGGHFMLSEDLRTVDPERLELIRRLLPVYPRAARPLDLFEHPFPQGHPALWSLSLPTSFGPMTALAVFNLTNETRKYRITPRMLGLEAGKLFLALEWWQYRWLGRFDSDFEIEVPAGDVAIIHAQPIKDVPSLVSVSHHFTGGYIVEDVEFDASTGMLKGVLATKAGLRVVLFGSKGAGWKLARTANFHATENSLGGWQGEVITTDTRTPFSIPFEKLRS
jgi:alpha-galactosidase